MDTLLKYLSSKKILILGFGREGKSTLRFVRRHFPDMQIGIADASPVVIQDEHVTMYSGEEYISHLTVFTLIIKTPGIPVSLPQIQQAIKSGVEITSQTALFFRLFKDRIIGVTGTKGKSTTSSLITHIVNKAHKNAVLIGNIGIPVLDVVESDTPDRWYVYELSAHQLSDVTQSPHIAVVLNIYREHLDYYKTMEAYIDAKEHITRFQSASDFFVYAGDQDELLQMAERSKARKIRFSGRDMRMIENYLKPEEIPLKGEMNRNNIMAAVSVADILNISPDSISEGIRTFTPLPYRLENVGTYKGIIFYDDALATIPEATIAALESFSQPIGTLIAGGFDRGQDFRKLAEKIIELQIKTLILFLPTGEKIKDQLLSLRGKTQTLPAYYIVKTMREAVQLAIEHTQPDTICLLSCASPSFGLFKDYADRSDQYKKYIEEFK